jgi:hypothetical protein
MLRWVETFYQEVEVECDDPETDLTWPLVQESLNPAVRETLPWKEDTQLEILDYREVVE